MVCVLQARGKIAAAKVLAPAAALAALDAAMQVHGGAGVSDDTPLARLYAGVRTLRIADGPRRGAPGHHRQAGAARAAAVRRRSVTANRWARERCYDRRA